MSLQSVLHFDVLIDLLVHWLQFASNCQPFYLRDVSYVQELHIRYLHDWLSHEKTISSAGAQCRLSTLSILLSNITAL